jgi:hypothetical protein
VGGGDEGAETPSCELRGEAVSSVSGAVRGGAPRKVARRDPGLTPCGCQGHQLPSRFGAGFPAFLSNRSCLCAPWADAAMKL